MKITIRKATEKDIKQMEKEPIWTCETKTFPWHYDEQETCLILEGEVTIKSEYEEVDFKAGDYVIFPQGLNCTWIVKKPVKKHYKFG